MASAYNIQPQRICRRDRRPQTTQESPEIVSYKSSAAGPEDLKQPEQNTQLIIVTLTTRQTEHNLIRNHLVSTPPPHYTGFSSI